MYRSVILGGLRKFIFLLVIKLMIESTLADHTTFCVTLPNVRLKRGLASIGMEKLPQTKDIWGKFEEEITAGAVRWEKLQAQRGIFHVQAYPRGKIKVYRVKNTRTKQYLNQWFRIELRFVINGRKSDLQESLKALLLYVRDDEWRKQNIGEFSLNFPDETRAGNSCPKNDANKYTIISCGGASRSEPLVSNTIVMVRNNSRLDGNIFPPGTRNIVGSLSGKHSLNFYIRIPIQDCNQKKMLIFRARMIFDKNVYKYEDGLRNKDDVIVATLFWRNNADNFNVGSYIPGAADALPSPSNSKHLDCNEEITASNVPWYAWKQSEVYRAHFKSEEFWPMEPDRYFYLHGCQGFYFRGRCNHNMHTLHSEYLRGKGDVDAKALRLLVNQNVAEENVIPICEHKPDDFDFFQINGPAGRYLYIPPKKFNGKDLKFPRTHDYLKQHDTPCSATYNEDATCNITAVAKHNSRRSVQMDTPRVADSVYYSSLGRPKKIQPRQINLEKEKDVIEYVNYTGNNHVVEKDTYKGIGFDENGFPKLIFGVRQGHAAVMALAMYLVLPVNLFITRYFKESFMNNRILYSRVWYVVHVHGTFIMATLLFSGALIAVAAGLYLGKSLTLGATLHRLFGWVAIILFIILTALGGFRGLKDPLRKITIFVHWFLGIIFYMLMVFEVLSAVYIPGSGVSSAGTDPSSKWRDLMENKTIQSGAFIHILLWIIVELVMHAIMMVNMCGFDKKMEIIESRMYFPVPIPVIREHSKLNTSGHGLRVICLAVYIFLALASTVWYELTYIISTSENDLGLGPMYCTHEYDGHHFKIRPNLTFNCN